MPGKQPFAYPDAELAKPAVPKNGEYPPMGYKVIIREMGVFSFHPAFGIYSSLFHQPNGDSTQIHTHTKLFYGKSKARWETMRLDDVRAAFKNFTFAMEKIP